jgi:uracil-DNA glycosylase family 4
VRDTHDARRSQWPSGSSPQRVRLYSSLEELNAAIDACRTCESLGPLAKPTRLARGGVAPVMVIGEAPGRVELKAKRAFAGLSGKRLDEWLVACGAPRSNPRRNVYLTSVIKCACPPRGPYRAMAKRCSTFLHEQVNLVKPSLIITLGDRAYTSLQLTDVSYGEAIGQTFQSADHMLLPPFDQDFEMLVWPHPSGLNRLLNEPDIQARLRASFAHVRPFLSTAA